jgi:hypothetical protein
VTRGLFGALREPAAFAKPDDAGTARSGESFALSSGAARLPLYPDAEATVKTNLRTIEAGGRAPLVAIGEFTEKQWDDINAARRGLLLHEIESREIVFTGRHLYTSRAKDGYTIDDIWMQIEAALSSASVVFANPKMTALESTTGRPDGYGNTVRDRAIFECTQRKPRAELFSVIPKGDSQKPITKKAHQR